MAKIENKAVKMGAEVNEKYFFPNINGKAVTVEAETPEEAEKKANELTK
jgi:hypothetical protein